MVVRRYTVGELVQLLGGAVRGDPAAAVSRVATLAAAEPDAISFFHRADYAAALKATRAGAVILGPAHAEATDKPRIVTDNPYLYFARVAQLLHPAAVDPPGISPSAIVDPTARIDATASVGPLAVIGARSNVQARAAVGAGCILGRDVDVGAATRLYPRVVLYDGTAIGQRCIIHSGAVIGSDGFGFAPDAGRWEKIPQIGAVVIGDDVELGANVTVDRGAIDDTVIENGVKIDNQVQIGHNCRIGAHTVIAGCTGIAGSTTVGQHCVIGGAVNLAGHITIADGTIVAGGTSITRSIRKADTYVGVFPFDRRADWLRNSAHLRRLDSLARRVADIERKIDAGAAGD